MIRLDDPLDPVSSAQDGPFPEHWLFRTARWEADGPARFTPHSHAVPELIFVSAGTLTVRTDTRLWTLTPGEGVWISKETTHDAFSTGSVTIGCTYLFPESETMIPVRTGRVGVPEILRDLLLHLNATQLPIAQRVRAQRVCVDLMHTQSRDLTDGAPRPADPRVQVMACTLSENPADPRSLEQWARTIGLSARSINRILQSDVGLPFARWRSLLRVRHAQALLRDGATVGEAAWQVGYATDSAFIQAFRRVTGETPGLYASGFRQ